MEVSPSSFLAFEVVCVSSYPAVFTIVPVTKNRIGVPYEEFHAYRKEPS